MIDDRTLRERYETGATLQELERLTGTSQRHVTRRLLAAGTTLRPPGHQRGKPHPMDVRRAISAAKKGERKPPFSDVWLQHLRDARSGRTPAKGMRHSEETRRRMSEQRRGAGNGRWIDGRKQKPYPPEWTKALRDSIRAKYGYCCALCQRGFASGLHVHHIDFNKQNCSTDNLIPLCFLCHAGVHVKRAEDSCERLLKGIIPMRQTPTIELPFKHLGNNVVIYDPCVVLRPEVVELCDNVRVDSMTKLEGGLGVRIGDYVHIASFCHVNIGGGSVIIGDYAAMASGAKIIAGSNQMDGLSMSAAAPQEMQSVKRSTVVIGPYAFLATNAVVMPGVTVGEGAVIGAGAVVTKHVPPWEVWAGVPARKIGERSKPDGYQRR